MLQQKHQISNNNINLFVMLFANIEWFSNDRQNNLHLNNFSDQSQQGKQHNEAIRVPCMHAH